MTSMPLTKQILGLFGWLAVTFGAAAVGATVSASAGNFYRDLSRPGWAPPAWVFAPVWSALYLLMGIAAWVVWREHGFRYARFALSLFLIQLVANALWTWLFFVWHQGALAVIEILILWALILATAIAFWRVQSVAAVLLIPYLAWVAFASVLAFAEWQRNPQLLG